MARRANERRGSGARFTSGTTRLPALVALLVLAALTYAPAVFGPPFYTKGEPREAVVVARMVESGDYILPHRTLTEIPAKPPMFHWLGAVASRAMGGVSESSVRVPSLAASLFVLAVIVLAGTRLFGSAPAWTGAILLATSQQWIASSVTARVDMLLAAAIAVAMFGLLSARSRAAPWPHSFWIGCALAVLAKGPVGVVVPLLCAAVFLVCRRDLGYARSIRPLHAALALAIALGWYVLAWQHAGDAFVRKVVSENIYRMVDTDAGDELGHRHSMLFYIPALLGGLAPWGVVLPFAAVELWRKRLSLDEPRVFALVWVLTTVGFFSLAGSKRPVYLLSCYPGASLLIGDWLSRRFREEDDTRVSLPRAAAACTRFIAGVTVVGAAMLALQSAGVPVLDALRWTMSPGDAANLVPTARSLEAHRAVVWPWFIGVLLAGAALSRAASDGAWRASFALVAVLVAGTTAVFGATVFRDVAETQSVKPFIENAARQLPDRTPLYYYAGSHAEPDLYFFKAFEYAAGFYARRPLTVIDRVDVAPGSFAWFITAEATLQQLERNVAPGGEQPSFRVLSRFTYGDNPRRTPVVFVEARRD